MALSLTQKETYRETLANLVAKQNDGASIVSAKKELEALSTSLVPRMLYRYRPPSEYAFADLENATLHFLIQRFSAISATRYRSITGMV